MMAPSKAAALAWLGAQGGASAGQAADMASLTDLQFRSLQLYLISLLPSWGKLVYTTWIHVGQAGPGAGGLVVTRTVEQLLYGERAWRGGAQARQTRAVCVQFVRARARVGVPVCGERRWGAAAAMHMRRGRQAPWPHARPRLPSDGAPTDCPAGCPGLPPPPHRHPTSPRAAPPLQATRTPSW